MSDWPPRYGTINPRLRPRSGNRPCPRTSSPILRSSKSKYTVATSPVVAGIQSSRDNVTKFLALGKVGQEHATYLELLELDHPKSSVDEQQYCEKTAEDKYTLCYDEEWLAVTRAYNDSLRITDRDTLIVPPMSRDQASVSAKTIADHRVWVREHVTHEGLLRIPENFRPHAPVYSFDVVDEEQPTEYPNAQTADFAQLLQLENRFAIKEQSRDDDDEGLEIGFGFD